MHGEPSRGALAGSGRTLDLPSRSGLYDDRLETISGVGVWSHIFLRPHSGGSPAVYLSQPRPESTAGAVRQGPDFEYALFFMTDEALQYINKGEGFEVGVGLSIGVVDTAVARKLRTMTVEQDIYAFIFGRERLMAGFGLLGSKITKIER
jgi:hypothetical protein